MYMSYVLDYKQDLLEGEISSVFLLHQEFSKRTKKLTVLLTYIVVKDDQSFILTTDADVKFLPTYSTGVDHAFDFLTKDMGE